MCIWQLITLAYLVTVFSVIWFFIGHIWFIPTFFGEWVYTSMRTFTIIMAIVHYMVDICVTYGRISHDPQVLCRFVKIIEDWLADLSDPDERVSRKESIADENTEDTNQQIIIF